MQLFCRARPARPYHPWPTRVRAAVAVLIIVSGVLLALAILAASERFHELPGDSYHARLEAAEPSSASSRTDVPVSERPAKARRTSLS